MRVPLREGFLAEEVGGNLSHIIRSRIDATFLLLGCRIRR